MWDRACAANHARRATPPATPGAPQLVPAGHRSPPRRCRPRDAGPTVACHRDAIRTVKDSRALPVSIETEPEGNKLLVAVNSIKAFRATRATVEVAAEHAYITAETADALRVKDGDSVRVMA